MREQRRRNGIVAPEPVVEQPPAEAPMAVEQPHAEAPMAVEQPRKRKREMSVEGNSLLDKKIKLFETELKIVTMSAALGRTRGTSIASSRCNNTLDI